VDRILQHIRKQGFYVTETEPSEDIRVANEKVCKVSVGDGYNASRTPMDSRLIQQVISAVEHARGPVIKLPTMGGSLPLYAIEEILGAPAIIVPIANHDDNQHSYNENIRLQNLWDGIETMAALLALRDTDGAGPNSTEPRSALPTRPKRPSPLASPPQHLGVHSGR